MTVAVSNLAYPVEKLVTGTLAFDDSYPTGGEQISASAFGLSRFTRIVMRPTGADAGGAGYVFDATISASGTTANILVFRSAGFTPAGTNSKPTFTVTKGAILASSELGLSADAATATVNNNTIAATVALTTNSPVSIPTFTGTAVAAGVLVQVANAVDLSALTAVPGDFYGY